MNERLATMMDAIGLQILVDEYISKVHHKPDLSRLPMFTDPRRIPASRTLYPAPPAIALESSEPVPHHDYELVTFTFRTPVPTPFPEDERVHGNLFLTHHAPGRGTVVLVHGGFLGAQPRGADLRPYLRWAIALSRLGLNAALPALPRHLDRAPAGTFSGERFMSGDLLETLEVIAQAVAELEALIGWIVAEGYGPVAVMGMSLGGLTSAQLLSVSPALSAAVLLAPVPDAPRTLFESPIGTSIRQDWIDAGASRADLEAAFEPLSYRHRRPVLDPGAIRLVYGLYDQVVTPNDVRRMGDAWGAEVWQAEEGHLGLISSNEVRNRVSAWMLEQLAGVNGPRG